MTEYDFTRGPMRVLRWVATVREIRARFRSARAPGSYQDSIPPHLLAVSPGFNNAGSPMHCTDIYPGRQPVLNRGWNVAGYATFRVIVNAVVGAGLDRLPGGNPAFIKFDRTLLFRRRREVPGGFLPPLIYMGSKHVSE
jgi:hypothetical protein